MVTYCCVKGCRNNSSEKRRSHRVFITFHAFPTNPEARLKWLKAIGRPSWDPPNHARVCSIHFSDDQINREHQRTRLKDDACPVRELPENSYFEATEMEVCRICLVTDVKMFSLQEEVLKICIKSVLGFNKDIEGLPQFVCYECAFQLLKCYNLVEKSNIAKATLLNIFAKNGEVTKHLVKSINRSQLNLQSSLTHYNVIPKTIVDMQYDEDLQKYMYTSQTEENIFKREKKSFQTEIILKKKSAKDNNSTKLKKHKISEVQDYKIEINLDLNAIENYKLEDTYLEDNAQLNNFVNMNDEVKDDIYHSDTDASEAYVPYAAELETEVKSDEDEPLINIKGMKQDLETEIVKNGKKTPHKIKKKPSANKHPDGLTPDEVEMQQFFNIVILTLEEQIQDREKMKESPAYRDALYKCDICYKTYLHPNAFKMHLENHDPNRGKAECPVCKLRYKNEVLVKSHAYRTHGKKFYCKTCPKVFNNVRIAKKHQKRHEGYVYKCPLCSFSSVHDSAYGVHVRTQHPARHVCPHCGHTFVSERGLLLHTHRTHTHEIQEAESEDSSMFRCKECDVRFTTESAWRVHMLTSSQHKKKRNFCEPNSTEDHLKSTCPRCGEQFATSKQLQEHNVAAHGKPAAKKMTWSLPGDSYPANCEHCGETVNNRKEHYFHVRKMHPKERESYQPVITAVCDTCGKGFQNSTKLHLHELRHTGVGTVRCPHCPRLFFDKYQLARHIGVHSDERPYACQLCDKAFKLRSNLDRHAKVHSGATPYECTMCGKRFRYSSSRNLHVRTVHYKMPHPPRKKRNNKQVRTVDSYENCVGQQ